MPLHAYRSVATAWQTLWTEFLKGNTFFQRHHQGKGSAESTCPGVSWTFFPFFYCRCWTWWSEWKLPTAYLPSTVQLTSCCFDTGNFRQSHHPSEYRRFGHLKHFTLHFPFNYRDEDVMFGDDITLVTNFGLSKYLFIQLLLSFHWNGCKEPCQQLGKVPQFWG